MATTSFFIDRQARTIFMACYLFTLEIDCKPALAHLRGLLNHINETMPERFKGLHRFDTHVHGNCLDVSVLSNVLDVLAKVNPGFDIWSEPEAELMVKLQDVGAQNASAEILSLTDEIRLYLYLQLAGFCGSECPKDKMTPSEKEAIINDILLPSAPDNKTDYVQ